MEAHAYYSMKSALNKLKTNRFWAVRKVRRARGVQTAAYPTA
jgi:hypothetical protein